MKRLIIILIFMVLLLSPNCVKSIYYRCDTTDFTKLQKIASNINTSYDYNEVFKGKYGEVTFSIKLNNMSNKLYIINAKTNQRYNYTSDEMDVANIIPGSTVKYKVYANDYGCNDRYISTIYINIPYYNKYYIEDACKDFQNYKLCNKWTKVDYSYEEFIDTINKYKNESNKQEDNVIKARTYKEIFLEILYFLDEYRFLIFGGIIIISSGLIVYLKYIKRKEYFDLK